MTNEKKQLTVHSGSEPLVLYAVEKERKTFIPYGIIRQGETAYLPYALATDRNEIEKLEASETAFCVDDYYIFSSFKELADGLHTQNPDMFGSYEDLMNGKINANHYMTESNLIEDETDYLFEYENEITVSEGYFYNEYEPIALFTSLEEANAYKAQLEADTAGCTYRIETL